MPGLRAGIHFRSFQPRVSQKQIVHHGKLGSRKAKRRDVALTKQRATEQPCSTAGGVESCLGPAAAPTII